MSAVSTYAYSRTHTSVYVSDKMRKLMTILVREYGLNPAAVANAWTQWVDRAVRTWLESGHLKTIIIEFYWPGTTNAEARWDFPIRYDGSGVDDEMWVDRVFLQESFSKAAVPPAGCSYRIVLETDPGRPHVYGVTTTNLLSVGGLSSREIGTVIATPDIMASGRYWR